MNDKLTEIGYRAAWRTVRMLPERGAERLFTAVANRTLAKNGKGVRQLRHNLARVVGPDFGESELDDLTRDAMRSYCRYWMEMFRLPSYSPAEMDTRFHLEGLDLVDRHRENGTGVVLAVPHSGNWDLAGACVAAKGYAITTVAQRLKPEGVFEAFLDFRRSLGMKILPHTGGELPLLPTLVERAAAGDIVPLVADRDLSRSGIDVEFFGGTARMPPGPAMVAIRSGAPLYTVVLRYDGPRHCYGKLEGPIDIPTSGELSERVAT
ncbi:MAG: phosphatidylinositol mannoside acyltransferase, partial [Stackebrandtia sp.]